MNESEAIDRLQSAGLFARPRDWSLGHSIFVGRGAFERNGISGYQHARYIYQAEDVWHVIDCVNADDIFPTLDAAVEHAAAALMREKLD
ncbi:hypothetical protein [Dyella acidiphila]|uniref:Uncharacterized protein n=1 Tax=Dyella acidiphila TaxID=2775866 RepID=A0ABR9GCK7_9GAMM|nr:hypothetical protein [Dyella acidiphila]MBE1161776.1 hypothetical protein [Dyella acidiphila]